MKKSEVLAHIEEMLEEIIVAKSTSSPKDKNFTARKAADILDTLLGFGMLPPVTTLKPLNIRDNGWDPE